MLVPQLLFMALLGTSSGFAGTESGGDSMVKLYSQKVMNLAVNYAVDAAEAHADGEGAITFAKGQPWSQSFDLVEGGMCCRFVRMIFEVASATPPGKWGYRGLKARDTLRALRVAGTAVDRRKAPLPGDIIGVETGTYGHIALCIGKYNDHLCVAENTSDNIRGNPPQAGTKITQYAELLPRVTSIYSLLEPKVQEKVIITVGAAGQTVVQEMPATLLDYTLFVPIRPMADLLGFTISLHVPGDNVHHVTLVKKG